jgi:acyl carrier protein
MNDPPEELPSMSTTVNDAFATIYARIDEVLTEFEITEAEVPLEAQLRADLDIDSAELVEIVAAVVDGDVPDGKQLSAVATVRELVELLHARSTSVVGDSLRG